MLEYDKLGTRKGDFCYKKRRDWMAEMTDREMLVAIYGNVEHIRADVTQLNVRVGNLESEVTELKEDVSTLKCEVTELKEDVSVLKEDVSVLKEDVSVLKEDVAVLKEDVTTLKDEVTELKEDVSTLKCEVTELKEDVSTLKCDVTVLKEDVKKTQIKISGIEMTLENEIRNNIRIVAEGHTDIIRKFDDYMIENSKEMFSVRMNILETDVRNIKEKIGIA